jgi:hypothetical protein
VVARSMRDPKASALLHPRGLVIDRRGLAGWNFFALQSPEWFRQIVEEEPDAFCGLQPHAQAARSLPAVTTRRLCGGNRIEFDWPLMIQPRFECTRRGCNQRIGIPATLVTPTVRFPGPNYLTINNER